LDYLLRYPATIVTSCVDWTAARTLYQPPSIGATSSVARFSGILENARSAKILTILLDTVVRNLHGRRVARRPVKLVLFR
jgi:hypothetical protein